MIVILNRLCINFSDRKIDLPAERSIKALCYSGGSRKRRFRKSSFLQRVLAHPLNIYDNDSTISGATMKKSVVKKQVYFVGEFVPVEISVSEIRVLGRPFCTLSPCRVNDGGIT